MENDQPFPPPDSNAHPVASRSARGRGPHRLALFCALLVTSAGCGGSTAPAALSLAAVTLLPATVQGGANSTGTVALSGAAPAGGAVVTLSSSQASAVAPPAVTVAEGQPSATFTVTTTATSADETATITASYGGVTKTAALAISPTPCALRTPGAQWLAFSAKRPDTYDIFAMRDDGTCLTQVTSGAGDDLFGVFADQCGSFSALRVKGGRKAATILSLR